MEILQTTGTGLWDIAIAGAFGWGAYALAKDIYKECKEVYHEWRQTWKPSTS